MTVASLADTATSSFPRRSCDIFCTVIDNFGDIGVCWRLARQLVHEYQWQIRLYVDDLSPFSQLHPDVKENRARQTVAGVDIVQWHEPMPAASTATCAEVVIEAFACELPSAYSAAMAQRERPPVWINLEYLSAEDWVAACHLRPSPHPRLPLTKTFFFPGLKPGTGGVLKENDLDARRQAFNAQPDKRESWWRTTIGRPAPGPEVTVISLFCYLNNALAPLLEQWRDQAKPMLLLVPEGRISAAIARFFGRTHFHAGAHAECGNLRVYGLPFVAQTEYDNLLWASHINFVRGEDSFVRAQWARQPYVWHLYPQSNDAHLPKLDAALAHYTAQLDSATRDATIRFWHAWNGIGTPDWNDFWQYRQTLHTHAPQWARQLSAIGDLAGNLVRFVLSQL